MKNIRHKIVGLLVIIILLLNLCNKKIEVKASTGEISLHRQTKIYNLDDDGYFNGCENYENYLNSSPTITVLTHGLSSNACYWSNDYNNNLGMNFAYNQSSIINKIYQRLDNEATLYIAGKDVNSSTINDDGFLLRKYTYNEYVSSGTGNITSRLDDVSKHIVIVYNSSISDESNANVYDEFHNILDSISLQYKDLTGTLPKFNLVGHSRGGLTNIAYAIEHPYNVSSIYSMGTPYNGAALGELEQIVTMLFSDMASSPGFTSIMNKQESKELRNAWNIVMSSNANIKAVSYGSMTSLSFIRAFINDLATNSSKYISYGDAIAGNIDFFETIIDVIEEHPNLTTGILTFIDGIARVFNKFGLNIYNELLNSIQKNLRGNVSYQDVSNVVKLVNVINDGIVIMDDLFVDLNSQLGFGFDDNIEYEGFTRYVKIFTVNDFSDNRAVPSEPGIVHNLEIMNETYVNNIAYSLVYGVPISNAIILTDGYKNPHHFSNSKSFSFSSAYSGRRTFMAIGCEIKLYKYDNSNCLIEVLTTNDNLTYDYISNEKYVLIVSKSVSGSVNISFSLQNKINKGNNTINLVANESRIYKIILPSSGYYLILLNDSRISISGAQLNTNTNYYVYIKANTEKYIYLSNTNSSSVSVSVRLENPNSAVLNETKIITSNEKVLKFTNLYDGSISYKLSIKWESGFKMAYVYNENGSSIATVSSSSNEKVYTFTLEAGQTCYIVYSSANSTITSKLFVNQTQLRWKIDGILYNTLSVLLERNNQYTVSLIILANGVQYDYDTTYITTSSDYFSFTNGILTIYDEAIIGYDITIYPIIDPEYMLSIEIGISGNDIVWNIENSTEVFVSWNNISNFQNIMVTLTNERYQNYSLSIVKFGNNKNKYDVTRYLPTILGKTIIHLEGFNHNGHEYINGENIEINDCLVDNMFGGGLGTINNEYVINCYRHLNNIRNAGTEYREDDEIHYFVQKYFVVTNNIALTGSWNPIDTPMNGGRIRGINDTITISELNINEKKSDKNIGFMRNVYKGTIENINFTNVCITIQNSISNEIISIGTIAGSALGGVIKNCHVSGVNSSTSSDNKAGLCVGTITDGKSLNGSKYTFTGGICGTGNNIINCTSNIMVKSYGDIGGIVGHSVGGVITNCIASGELALLNNNVDLLNDSQNKSVGGIVGIARGTNITNSLFEGIFEYISPGIYQDKDLAPRIGEIIGTSINSYVNGKLVNDRIEKSLVEVHFDLLISKSKYNQKRFTKYKIGKVE